jgi:hypothetical protein
MKLKKLLGSQAYWTINKQLAKTIGLKATLLLQHLIDLDDSFFNGTSFYQQADRLSDDLGLSLFQIRNAKKTLIENDLIEVVKRGVPAKDHFKLHEDKIFNLLTSTGEESETLEVKKVNDKNKESIETKNQVKPNNIKNNKLSSSIAEASEDLNRENEKELEETGFIFLNQIKQTWSGAEIENDLKTALLLSEFNKEKVDFMLKNFGLHFQEGRITKRLKLEDYISDLQVDGLI